MFRKTCVLVKDGLILLGTFCTFPQSVYKMSEYHLKAGHDHFDNKPTVILYSSLPLPDNTQHSEERDIHVPGGIRTRNPGKQTAAILRLRLRGHWDRHLMYCTCKFHVTVSLCCLFTKRRGVHLETGLSCPSCSDSWLL
jgi:hypothetical protein